jgi:hypothetical protein
MKYFIGIAMNNKMKNEIPSANAIIRNTLIWLIFAFLPSSPSNINPAICHSKNPGLCSCR